MNHWPNSPDRFWEAYAQLCGVLLALTCALALAAGAMSWIDASNDRKARAMQNWQGIHTRGLPDRVCAYWREGMA